MARELTAEELRKRCDPTSLQDLIYQGFPYLQSIVGQQRAVESLEFGLGMGQMGFNIYVGGPPGTGKSTAVRAYLEEVAQGTGNTMTAILECVEAYCTTGEICEVLRGVFGIQQEITAF